MGAIFRLFAENQYVMYEMIQDKPELHKKFESCYRDNHHSIWAIQELYRSGNSREKFFHILQENMKPVYDLARRREYEALAETVGSLFILFLVV